MLILSFMTASAAADEGDRRSENEVQDEKVGLNKAFPFMMET